MEAPKEKGRMPWSRGAEYRREGAENVRLSEWAGSHLLCCIYGAYQWEYCLLSLNCEPTCVSSEWFSWTVDAAACEHVWSVQTHREHDKNTFMLWMCDAFARLAFLHRWQWPQIESVVQESSLRLWQMLPLFQNLCNLLHFEMNYKLSWLFFLFCSMPVFLFLMHAWQDVTLCNERAPPQQWLQVVNPNLKVRDHFLCPLVF